MSEFRPPKFGNEAKIRKQMASRGWTEQQMVEAMNSPGIATTGKLGPATRYVHPVTE